MEELVGMESVWVSARIVGSCHVFAVMSRAIPAGDAVKFQKALSAPLILMRGHSLMARSVSVVFVNRVLVRRLHCQHNDFGKLLYIRSQTHLRYS